VGLIYIRQIVASIKRYKQGAIAMAVNENGNLRPDGISVSLPRGLFGVGGTYYWNPGSSTAPALTLTGGVGMGGGGANLVFLRKGMTSLDTLGYGASANLAAIGPSTTINGSIPDVRGIPQPWNAKVSSTEAGIGLPGFSANYTTTPAQIGNYLSYLRPAMGPDDELSPFVRSLQSGPGAVGPVNSQPPVRFVSSRYQNPLGDGMTGWPSSVNAADPQYAAQPAPSPERPGGLLGLLLDQLRDNPIN
jgi:hypothetical protein